jgi:hypothetical protein
MYDTVLDNFTRVNFQPNSRSYPYFWFLFHSAFRVNMSLCMTTLCRQVLRLKWAKVLLALTIRDADNFAQEDLSQMRLGILVLILTYCALCFLSAKYGRRVPDHSRCTPRES